MVKAVSVILYRHGQISYAKQCVEAICRHFPQGQYEIIILEKQSEPDFENFISPLSGVRICRIDSTAGMAEAFNMGAQCASGQSFMFLTDDVVITEKVLPIMLDAFAHDDGLGAVGPVSNHARFRSQLIEADDYSTFGELEDFAEKAAKSMDTADGTEVPFLEAFCLLTQRDIWLRLKGFDIGYQGSGVFAIDFTLRLRAAGYGLRCLPCYVHRERGQYALPDLPDDEDRFFDRWGFATSVLGGDWSKELLKFGRGAPPNKIAKRAKRYREAVPLVSVMIPTYNRPRYFELTLKSALSQTYPNIEVIVADNSTNEDTCNLMKRYKKDPRVTYLRNRNAKTKADNFAPFEKLARGEYCQWLMDDDILAPEKIERMMKMFFAYGDVTLVTSRRGTIDADGNEQKEFVNLQGVPDADVILPGVDAGRGILLYASNYIGEPSAVLFRRHDLVHHYWRADCRGYQTISDVVMWLELLEKGNLAIFKEPLSWYRRHEKQEGQAPDVVLLAFLEWERLITEYHQRKIYILNSADYHFALQTLQNIWKRFEPVLFSKGSVNMIEQYRARVAKIEKILSQSDG